MWLTFVFQTVPLNIMYCIPRWVTKSCSHKTKIYNTCLMSIKHKKAVTISASIDTMICLRSVHRHTYVRHDMDARELHLTAE